MRVNVLSDLAMSHSQTFITFHPARRSFATFDVVTLDIAAQLGTRPSEEPIARLHGSANAKPSGAGPHELEL